MGLQHQPSWTHRPIYWAIRTGLTLPLVAGAEASIDTARSVGAAFGRSALNRKHMGRALTHLTVAFPEWDEAHRQRVAIESFQHMMMLAVEMAWTPRLLTADGWTRHIEFVGAGQGLRALVGDRPTIHITGHCGNWEVLGCSIAMLGFPMHALYRPLDLRPLDRWVRTTRARAGLSLLDKFGAAQHLPRIIAKGEPIGFVADQNGGDRGLFVPFFGRLASSYKSIGLLAMMHDAVVVCGQARRLGWREKGILAPADRARVHERADGFRFRIEIEDVITPEDYRAQPDPVFYLTARYRRAIEAMIRKEPGDYFWMHRSWRSRPVHERRDRDFPARLRDRLEALPWMTPGELGRIIDQSDRDRATLRELGVTKLP